MFASDNSDELIALREDDVVFAKFLNRRNQDLPGFFLEYGGNIEDWDANAMERLFELVFEGHWGRNKAKFEEELGIIPTGEEFLNDWEDDYFDPLPGLFKNKMKGLAHKIRLRYTDDEIPNKKDDIKGAMRDADKFHRGIIEVSPSPTPRGRATTLRILTPEPPPVKKSAPSGRTLAKPAMQTFATMIDVTTGRAPQERESNRVSGEYHLRNRSEMQEMLPSQPQGLMQSLDIEYDVHQIEDIEVLRTYLKTTQMKTRDYQVHAQAITSSLQEQGYSVDEIWASHNVDSDEEPNDEENQFSSPPTKRHARQKSVSFMLETAGGDDLEEKGDTAEIDADGVSPNKPHSYDENPPPRQNKENGVLWENLDSYIEENGPLPGFPRHQDGESNGDYFSRISNAFLSLQDSENVQRNARTLLGEKFKELEAEARKLQKQMIVEKEKHKQVMQESAGIMVDRQRVAYERIAKRKAHYSQEMARLDEQIQQIDDSDRVLVQQIARCNAALEGFSQENMERLNLRVHRENTKMRNLDRELYELGADGALLWEVCDDLFKWGYLNGYPQISEVLKHRWEQLKVTVHTNYDRLSRQGLYERDRKAKRDKKFRRHIEAANEIFESTTGTRIFDENGQPIEVSQPDALDAPEQKRERSPSPSPSPQPEQKERENTLGVRRVRPRQSVRKSEYMEGGKYHVLPGSDPSDDMTRMIANKMHEAFYKAKPRSHLSRRTLSVAKFGKGLDLDGSDSDESESDSEDGLY